MAPTKIYINIYNEDGDLDLSTTYLTNILTVEVVSDGLKEVGGDYIYTYTGGYTFLGFATEPNQTQPSSSYVVGSHEDLYPGTHNFYVITASAPQPTAKTVINGLTPTKKMFGTTEIIKEVLNGVTVYEKQVSSYSVSINVTEENRSDKFYLKIYDGQDDTGTLLHESTTSISGQTLNLTCTSGYLYTDANGRGGTNIEITNIVGDITKLTFATVTINSNGSFSLLVDYDF